ncbi:MAG: hypothetical protein ACRDOJ_10935, partial [Nocardioidaceae bacterium]
MSHPSTTRRPLRWWSLVSALLLTVTLAPAIATASPAGEGGGSAREDNGDAEGWIRSRMARMTLEEKVGQLFMTHAYGETADTQAPADVAANQEMYGVDNAEQLMDR